MRPVFYIFTILLVSFNILFADNLLLQQKHLEETAQSALNRILGDGRSIIYISLMADEAKWEVNYTKVPEVEGLTSEQGVKKQQTVMPGIPSLRFMSDAQGSGGEPSVPIDYEVVERSPQVKEIDVILILDSKIKLGDLRAVKLFVTKFLNLDEQKGDKLTILKETFSEEAKQESLSKQKLTTKNKASPLTIILAALAALALIVALFVFAKFRSKGGAGSGKQKAELTEGVSDAEGKIAQGQTGEKTAEQLAAEEEALKKKEEEEKIEAMNNNILGNGTRYFNFVNEENIYKLKFLLQVKIALQQATPRTIAVVMACLPFKLAASILIEYPIKIQAEICNNLLNLQHYPEKDLIMLEAEVKNNIDYLFGGKYRIKQIFERVPGEMKKSILSLVNVHYPAIADELSMLVVLFEDILALDEQILARIYSDIDTEVIATSLVQMEPTLQRKVTGGLPKGVQSMVEQWLTLKSNTASRYDIEIARQKVISYAQHLEKEGFIKLNHD